MAVDVAENASLKTIKALAPIILALIALLSSVFAYNRADSHVDARLTERVTAVEVQQKNDGEGIKRVESKIDKLLDWAFIKH